MSGHEVDLAFQWLYSTLSGDSALLSYATGGVFRSLAPVGTTPPYVIMAFQGGSDVTTQNAFRLFDDLVFQVKVVGPAKITGTLASAATRIDQLLGLTAGAITGAVIGYCYRQSPLQMDELVDGELWSNFGGLYRVAVQLTP